MICRRHLNEAARASAISRAATRNCCRPVASVLATPPEQILKHRRARLPEISESLQTSSTVRVPPLTLFVYATTSPESRLIIVRATLLVCPLTRSFSISNILMISSYLDLKMEGVRGRAGLSRVRAGVVVVVVVHSLSHRHVKRNQGSYITRAARKLEIPRLVAAAVSAAQCRCDALAHAALTTRIDRDVETQRPNTSAVRAAYYRHSACASDDFTR